MSRDDFITGPDITLDETILVTPDMISDLEGWRDKNRDRVMFLGEGEALEPFEMGPLDMPSREKVSTVVLDEARASLPSEVARSFITEGSDRPLRFVTEGSLKSEVKPTPPPIRSVREKDEANAFSSLVGDPLSKRWGIISGIGFLALCALVLYVLVFHNPMPSPQPTASHITTDNCDVMGPEGMSLTRVKAQHAFHCGTSYPNPTCYAAGDPKVWRCTATRDEEDLTDS